MLNIVYEGKKSNKILDINIDHGYNIVEKSKESYEVRYVDGVF